MDKKILGAIAIITAAIIWAFDGTFLTPRLYNLNVVFVVFMIHLIPFVLMNTFLFAQYKYMIKFSKSDYFYLSLVALFGGAIGTLAIVKALFLVNFQQLSVILLLQKLQPLFAILLALILLKERVEKRFIFWGFLAIFASYFLTFGFSLPSLPKNSLILHASLYALLAAFSFGSATVFGKKIVTKYNFKTATFYRFFFTTIIVLIYILFFGKMSFGAITQTNWIILFITAILTGIISIFLYYYGLTKVKASVSAILELAFPISAVILDYFINKSVLSPVQLIAAAVMMFSIIKITKRNS